MTAAAIKRIVVQTKLSDKQAIVAKAKALDITVSELMVSALPSQVDGCESIRQKPGPPSDRAAIHRCASLARSATLSARP